MPLLSPPPPSVRVPELLSMLRQLLVLLTFGGGWTSGALARDRFDKSVHPLDSKAVKWCLLGAAARVAWRDIDEQHREDRYDTLIQALTYVEPSFYTRTIARYSDEEGKDQVLNIIRRSIEVQEHKLEHIR